MKRLSELVLTQDAAIVPAFVADVATAIADLVRKDSVRAAPSPSKAGGDYSWAAVVVGDRLFRTDGTPWCPVPVPTTMKGDFGHFAAPQSLKELGTEAQWYIDLSVAPPAVTIKQVRQPGADMTAEAVHGALDTRMGLFALPKLCKPELFITADAGSWTPSYASEGKTVPVTDIMNEMSMYHLMFLVKSYFPHAGEAANEWLFYDKAPCGIGVIALGFAGVLAYVEMVGKLFVGLIRDSDRPAEPQMFVVGREVHEKLVNSHHLVCKKPTRCLHLPVSDTQAWQDCSTLKRQVLWTAVKTSYAVQSTVHAGSADGTDEAKGEEVHYNRFLKIISHDAYTASDFYRIARVYTHGAWKEEDLPPSLRRPELWFGELQVCITMPFVDGSAPSEHAVVELAEAVRWLLQHGMLYTDWRLQNIVQTMDSCVLVDYDDIIVLEDDDRVASVDEYVDHIRRSTAFREGVANELADRARMKWPQTILGNVFGGAAAQAAVQATIRDFDGAHERAKR